MIEAQLSLQHDIILLDLFFEQTILLLFDHFLVLLRLLLLLIHQYICILRALNVEVPVVVFPSVALLVKVTSELRYIGVIKLVPSFPQLY